MDYRVAVDHVSKTYRLGKVDVTALDDVSFTVATAEFVAIAGPSGSGKTTLLNLIGCLDTPTAGEILIDGDPVSALSAGGRADLRQERHHGPGIEVIERRLHLVAVNGTVVVLPEHPLHCVRVVREDHDAQRADGQHDRQQASEREPEFIAKAFHHPLRAGGP